ncbi:MAG: hypothetical protein ACFFAV_05495 [Candidatus Hermodarchaeota archaeon]
MKSNRFVLLMLLISVFSAFMLFSSVNYSFILENLKEDPINLHELRISGPEININTPENITYTEPMSGYYPATYGFESDTDGTLPSYIVNLGDFPISVVSSRSGHNKVLWFDDNGYSYRASCYNNFSLNVDNGTIELWFLIDDAYDRTGLITRQGDTALVQFSSRYDKWKYHTSTQTDLNMQRATGGDMPSPLDNTWHHIRIDFECTTGKYSGLDQYAWKCWIDGIESAEMPFQNNATFADNFYMSTSTAHTSYNMYIDAIGYSWDPHYNVGDNLDEGLLFSYDTSFIPDWQGYSFDNQLNKTILGNTTFPYPSLDGIHTIQVFGNNTMGTMYKSDIRYFTINTSYYLNIITPENITYTEPMSGYYPATYGFESDPDGTLPSYLINADNYPISVVSSRSGHNKVLWFDDNGYSYRASCYNNFSMNVDNGTIEYWFLVDDAYDRTGLAIRQEKNNLVSMGSRYDQWRYQTATQTDLIIQKATGGNMPAPLDNTWYHIRIAFECTTGNYLGLDQYTWKCWIDGVESAEMPFQSNEFYSDNFYMSTSTAHTSYNMYIDAIGYSWDPNYEIGDNVNEGLLLSFDTSFTPEWIGYSLDNQLNKTILGNTTFPYPSLNGIHTIQVFGNDSIGTMYESDIRYFTINSSYYLNIITPENITYTEPMSGYYPATYGFEDSGNGENPQGWTVVDIGGQVSIEANIGGHNKIVDIYKTSAGSGISCGFSQDIDNQTSGTIEFWWRVTSTSKITHFMVFENSIRLITLSLYDNSMLRYHDQGNWYYGFTYSADTWYLVSVDINMSTDTYSFSIFDDQGNLKQSGTDFTFEAVVTGDNFNRIDFNSGNFVSGYHHYVDAVGYSWDPNYEIGDNENEGLLLSLETNFTPEWIGYSLDGQTNKTILGNTTFPYPSLDGIHTIQVFSNNSIGTFYESDIRYFTINTSYYLNIITPENITYTEPMSGYYPATYGFEDTRDGSYPNGWKIEEESGTTFQIISGLDGHHKVAEFYDNDNTNIAYMRRDLCSTQIHGEVEWWMRISALRQSYVAFRENDVSGAYATYIAFNYNGWLQYCDGASQNIQDYTPNTWYHIKLEFNCDTDKINVSVNGVQKITNGNFWNPVNNIGGIEFYSGGAGGVDYNFYIDAIGFSWDPYYAIGDNFNEGLLLSFEKTPNFKWIGYSLDGNNNITIIGNITLPMLDNGLHSIQLFGNNSLGYFYSSDIRYFTLNIPIAPPQISINFPQAGDFYGYNAPYFEVSITSLYLDAKWYTLDNGMTKITFEGLSGTINQLEWENYGHGPVTIKFYANDTFGQESYAKITINKDLSPPNTTLLFTPYSGLNVVTDLTVFYLIADDHFESGVSIIRYRINSSSWIIYSGAFRLSGFSPGDYLITYQAFDLVGNIESEQTNVVNLYNTPDRISEISVPLTLSIILVASIGIAISIFAASILHDRNKSRIFIDEKKKRIDKITKDF